MLKDSTIRTLINNGLEERNDLFLIDLKITEDNKINVIMDGDNGVSVEDCMYISRAIEHNLDREEEDFSLEVTSAGATSLLVDKRQYKKNIGRTIQLKSKTLTKIEALLTDVADDYISIEWKVKEQKPVGKGKIIVSKEAKIAFEDVIEAKVIIKF